MTAERISTMKTRQREFEILIPKADGSGVAEKVKVMVPVRWDEEVQTWVMTPEAHRIIDDAKARLIGLLLPAEFKELRERYGYTQKEMGALLQVGEKSWTRWESGKQRPSRSLNLLIRALSEGEISLNYLLKRAGKPAPRESERVLQGFQHLCKTWYSPEPEWASPLTPYFATAAKPVEVQLSHGHGQSAIVAKLLHSMHEEVGTAEETTFAELPHRRLQYGLLPPSHTYRQPKLTTPTVA